MQKNSWAVPIICALIAAGGAVFSGYSNHKTQSDIEILKTNSEQQVTKIKTDTQREIAQSEFRSQENIVRLNGQLEAEKDLRAQTATNEAAAVSARVQKCGEIKTIRDGMSSDITHVRYNDPSVDDALLRLQAAYYKLTSYLSQESFSIMKSSIPPKESPDLLQRNLEFFRAVLAGYNAELTQSCAK